MDLHISVIADFKASCPDVEVVDWCLSGHAWVMKRKQDSPQHINSSSWKSLNVDQIRKFQETYDSFLNTFDGFIVGHVGAFAMIYEKYNKPILFINSCRYDLPFCWTKNMEMITKLHDCLSRLTEKRLLTIVSNNKADQLYTKLGTGLTPLHIPSLCLYTNTTYTPTKNTFLCYSGTFPKHPLLVHKRDIAQPYEWSDITSFQGVVHYPYEISLMSIFEQFSAGCPLFFPSKSFWKSNPTIQSISAYWGNPPPYFNELNTEDKWIDLADMYTTFQSPNTHYYDSNEHLFELLEKFEYIDDRELRKHYIEAIQQKWSFILRDIQTRLFWNKSPRHLCYNRLPLIANVVYDANYQGSGVSPQHAYPYREGFSNGDIVFVKTDLLSWFLKHRSIQSHITLVTGVSDLSPTQKEFETIVNNPYIRKWIGCNISFQHAKILKIAIGVGEPERRNGNHEQLLQLHSERPRWEDKKDEICVPYHAQTNHTRTLVSTLEKLEFEDYMKAIGLYKFVVCQRGNGIDTHRFCEVLLMGSIPVIEHSGLDDMYAQWPCLIVESFARIDTSTFVFDEPKYQSFLDMFWLRDSYRGILYAHITNEG